MAEWTIVEYVKIVFVCSLWYLCSTGAGIIGKIILFDFPYPLTITMAQLIIISVVLGPVLSCVGITKRGSYSKRYFVLMMMPLALGKFVTSLSTYMSIWRVSVSYAHTVKATLPLFTVVLTKIILGEGQTLPVYLSLLPIITGVGVATLTEVTFDFIGLLFALISTVFSCLLNIFSKKCLKDVGYHHLQLLLVINRLAATLFMPVWILADLPLILNHTQQVDHSQAIHTFLLLVCNGFFNMFNNIFAFTVLAKVSPLSYSVANATKRIIVISGSILVLQNSVSPLNILGMLTAVFGVLAYNKAKYEQVQKERRQKILPYVHSDSNLPHLGVPHMPHSKSDADIYTNGDFTLPDSAQPSPPSAFVASTEQVWEGKEVDGDEKEENSTETEVSKEPASSSVKVYFDGPSAVLHSRGLHQV